MSVYWIPNHVMIVINVSIPLVHLSAFYLTRKLPTSMLRLSFDLKSIFFILFFISLMLPQTNTSNAIKSS